MKKIIPVEVSARHVHLSQKDIEVLFGVGYELKEIRRLTQFSDFAAEETLNIQSNGREIKNVRVVGPIRPETQIEISLTDMVNLGLPMNAETIGDLSGSNGITLVGPKGSVLINRGVIIAGRHLHCTAEEAKRLRLKNGQIISVVVRGQREITFHNIKVRTGEKYRLCLQLDTDEGNAVGVNKQSEGEII
ncbi:MAG: phosphate propanoyltransferase [Candidatus Staskawiczbacteria bacterium]|jgi:putative phosphotransacetylase